MAPRTIHTTKSVDDGSGGAAVDAVVVEDEGNNKRNGNNTNDNNKNKTKDEKNEYGCSVDNVMKEDDDDDDDDGEEDDNVKEKLCSDDSVNLDSAADDIRGFDNGDDERTKEEEEDDDDDNDVEDDSAIPVDKGRAWLVMISCFLMHILVVGGGKSFGVFVQEFQDRFQVGAKELGIINGIALFLMLGLSIFVNMLAVKFSARRVVTAGSVLTSAGFVMTAFIPSFKWLYVTYGVVTGLGLALSFSPTIVMVGQCFKKYRTVALSFAVSGAGVGAFTFPGLARILINQYGLRGCLLIIGGIMLNVAICGFLLPPHRSKTSKRKLLLSAKKKKLVGEVGDRDERDSCGAERVIMISQNGDVGESCKGVHSNHDKRYTHHDIESTTTDRNNSNSDECLRKRLEYYPLTQKTISGGVFVAEDITIEVIDNDALEFEIKIPPPFSDNKEPISLSSDHISKHGNSRLGVRTKYDNGIHNTTNCPTNGILSKSANFLHVQCPHIVGGSNENNNLQYHQHRENGKSVSTSHLPDPFKPKTSLSVERNNLNTRIRSHNKISASLAYMSNCDLAMHSQGNLERLSLMSSRSKVLRSGERGAKGKGIKEKPALFEWSLLTNPPFIMHFFSAYLGYICYITNLFMLADYANTCGLDRDTAALTLSVVGILELIARLTFPPITEVLCCRRRTCWGFSLAVMGLLNLAVPYFKVLSSIMTYAVLFGYACGCFTALIPVLCAEIKGPEKMGSSFGLTTIGMGSAVLTGPPLSGTIKDMTGHWDHGFVTVGCLALVAATLAFLEPFVQTRWNARHENKQENNK